MDHRRARAVLAVVFAATVLIGLNATMLSVALPAAIHDLDASPVEGTWMLLAYLVVAGSGLVLSGQLADCLNLAAVFRAGLAAFGLSALGLALSSDPLPFIVARAMQGAGAALLLSTAAAIIAVSRPGDRRRGAMAIYLAGFSIAQVSGPMIGGLITSALGWRWLFIIGALIAGGALALGWRPLAGLPTRGFSGLRVDLPGNVLIFAMTTLVIVAFSGVQQVGWADPRTAVPLGLTVLLIPLFVAVEHRSLFPAIAVDLLKDRAFALANVASFCLAVGRIVPAVLLSLWFQGLEGDDAVTAALKITPLAAAVTVGTLMVERLFRGRDDVVTSRITAVTAVVGSLVLLAAVLMGGQSVVLLVGLVIIGLGTGGFQTVNSTMILGMRPLHQAGTVNGIRATAQQSAISLGTALLLSLGASHLSASASADYYAGRAALLSVADQHAVISGHVTALCVLVAFSVVGLVAVLGLRHPPKFRGT
ncbi:MFS transporter [Intrasporangium calvum]|uniref:MFS transporter n=1 Tax=Intrasporangium calvum TaxID=53358 RepID=A0ABT5GE18_9MICO|nr:MFS transporter [Intrasporangium calvum]MDC5696500.1 MFS transporter [Intrasporangium calvum]